MYPEQSGRDELVLAVLQSADRLFYIPSWMDTYSTYTKGPVEYKEGNQYVGRLSDDGGAGAADRPGRGQPAPAAGGIRRRSRRSIRRPAS